MTRITLLSLLLLSSCAVPYQQPQTAVNVDPGFSQLAAQATSTRAASNVTATYNAAAATGQAIIAAQNAAVTGTAVAMQATFDSAYSTATRQAQETAVVQSTAAAYQQSREEIELSAQGTRMSLETEATRRAIFLQMERADDKAAVMRWFWPGMAFIILTALAGVAYAFYRILIRNSYTVRDKDGEVISYRGHFLLPESIAPPAIDDDGYQGMTVNNRNGSHGFDRYRQPRELKDGGGRLIYQFSGRQLDSLINNIQNGDIGFRRDSSGQGPGLDTLIGMKNRELFSNILEEMKNKSYVADAGNGHAWTQRGMTEFLGMSTLPHFV